MRTKKPSGTPSAASSTSRPPEPLTVFLDESLDSDSIAQALADAGAVVERLTKHFAKGTDDSTWLSLAGARGWIVLTRDKRIRYRRLERFALQAAGVRAFVFTGGNVTLAETARILAGAVNAIREICDRERGPFIYHRAYRKAAAYAIGAAVGVRARFRLSREQKRNRALTPIFISPADPAAAAA